MKYPVVEVLSAEEPAARLAWEQPLDARGLAIALDVRISSLWNAVLHTASFYRVAQIPKKSGAIRTLHIPDDKMAWVQRRMLRAFFDRIEWPEHVSAYVLGRAPTDAAALHAGRPVLVILDLKDFFPTTKRQWVRDAFVEMMGFGQEAAEMAANVCTCPWQLTAPKARFRVPQGAPTSGAAANLVACHRLDPRILEICGKYGMLYTRYADDLAFSRETDLSREETSGFIREIIEAIKASGFRVNYDKIRVQRKNRQQRLLGLTINEFPNVPKNTYRRLWAIVHRCSTKGIDVVAASWGVSPELADQQIRGHLIYCGDINPQKLEPLRAKYEMACARTP